MTQYECFTATQVAKKVCEICNLKYTQADRRAWIEYCKAVKKGGSDNIDYTEFVNGAEVDCSIFLGYDKAAGVYLVGKED